MEVGTEVVEIGILGVVVKELDDAVANPAPADVVVLPLVVTVVVWMLPVCMTYIETAHDQP